MKTFLLAVGVLVFLASRNCHGQQLAGRSAHGEAYARTQVQQAVQHREMPLTPAPLLARRETAVAVAEAVLCSVYGEKNIRRQEPYEVYLVEGYWYVAGTLPAGWDGGVFEVVLSAANGQVLMVKHGK